MPIKRKKGVKGFRIPRIFYSFLSKIYKVYRGSFVSFYGDNGSHVPGFTSKIVLQAGTGIGSNGS
jgi:hypothetical protein